MKTSLKKNRILNSLAFSLTLATSIASASPGNSQDMRTPIFVTAAERVALLEEMRHFLETVQEISAAATENDMETVSQTAAAVGMKLARTTPPALLKKFPASFSEMAATTHVSFDELSLSASVSDDPLEIVAELADVMLICTACHSTYRFEIE
jgi:cytochrome c556